MDIYKPQLISQDSTVHFFITADIANDAQSGNTVSIDTLKVTDFQFSPAVNSSGSVNAGGTLDNNCANSVTFRWYKIVSTGTIVQGSTS